jgi:dUTPase
MLPTVPPVAEVEMDEFGFTKHEAAAAMHHQHHHQVERQQQQALAQSGIMSELHEEEELQARVNSMLGHKVVVQFCTS